MGEGVVKNLEKLVTLFMDGPKDCLVNFVGHMCVTHAKGTAVGPGHRGSLSFTVQKTSLYLLSRSKRWCDKCTIKT